MYICFCIKIHIDSNTNGCMYGYMLCMYVSDVTYAGIIILHTYRCKFRGATCAEICEKLSLFEGLVCVCVCVCVYVFVNLHV
jgi:hypothetical protein